MFYLRNVFFLFVKLPNDILINIIILLVHTIAEQGHSNLMWKTVWKK